MVRNLIFRKDLILFEILTTILQKIYIDCKIAVYVTLKMVRIAFISN